MDELSHPPKMTAETPDLVRRFGMAALFAVTLSVFTAVAWLVIAFLSMAIARSEGAIMLIGYFQIGLIPIGALAGAVTGAFLGFFWQRGKAIKRWLLGAGVLSLIALAINGFFALVS